MLTLKEFLLLIACIALGMGATEHVMRVDSHDPVGRFFALIVFCCVAPIAAFGALAIVVGAIVRYCQWGHRNSQD